MAKLNRERKLAERRLDKRAKKEARKQSAALQSAEGADGARDAPDEVIPASPDA